MRRVLLSYYKMNDTEVSQTTATITCGTTSLTYNAATNVTLTVTRADGAAYNGELTLSYGSGISGATSVTCSDGTATVSITCSSIASSYTLTVTVPETRYVATVTETFTFEMEKNELYDYDGGTYFKAILYSLLASEYQYDKWLYMNSSQLYYDTGYGDNVWKVGDTITVDGTTYEVGPMQKEEEVVVTAFVTQYHRYYSIIKY